MRYFQQHTRAVRTAAPKASRAAASVFSKLADKTRYADPGLSDNWPTIAGTEIAQLARPGRVTGRGPGRTLEVVVRDGSAAAQMQMQVDALIAAVNQYLGPGSIAHIAIRQKHQPARKPAKARGSRDDELDSALSSFMSAVSGPKTSD